MAPHSSTLAWKIPWTEEPDRLQSMGSLRVGDEWATSLHFHFSLSCIGEGNGNPLQCSCLESPRDGGAWWAAVYGVAQSRTRLKWLRSNRYIQTVKYCSAVKRNVLSSHKKIYWNLKCILLNERGQSEKVISYIIPTKLNPRKKQSHCQIKYQWLSGNLGAQKRNQEVNHRGLRTVKLFSMIL